MHLDFCERLFPNGLLVFVLNIRHSQVISPAAFNIAKEEEAYSECLDAVPPALLHNNKSFNLQPFCLSQVCQIPVFPLIFYTPTGIQAWRNPKRDMNVQQIPTALLSVEDQQRHSLCNLQIWYQSRLCGLKLFFYLGGDYCEFFPLPQEHKKHEHKAETVFSQKWLNNIHVSEFVAFCCTCRVLISILSIMGIFWYLRRMQFSFLGKNIIERRQPLPWFEECTEAGSCAHCSSKTLTTTSGSRTKSASWRPCLLSKEQTGISTCWARPLCTSRSPSACNCLLLSAHLNAGVNKTTPS